MSSRLFPRKRGCHYPPRTTNKEVDSKDTQQMFFSPTPSVKNVEKSSTFRKKAPDVRHFLTTLGSRMGSLLGDRKKTLLALSGQKTLPAFF